MIGGAQVQQQPPGFVKATAWTVWLWILKPFVWSFAFILFVYLFDFPKNELVKTIIHSLLVLKDVLVNTKEMEELQEAIEHARDALQWIEQRVLVAAPHLRDDDRARRVIEWLQRMARAPIHRD